jgi:hypothetical protein
MTELFDTSSIDDDPAHWDAQAERVAAAAARERSESGVDWLATSKIGWLAAALLVVAALASIAPAESPAAESLDASWSQAVAPSDAVGKAVVGNHGPPEIGTLLFGTGGG